MMYLIWPTLPTCLSKKENSWQRRSITVGAACQTDMRRKTFLDEAFFREQACVEVGSVVSPSVKMSSYDWHRYVTLTNQLPIQICIG